VVWMQHHLEELERLQISVTAYLDIRDCLSV